MASTTVESGVLRYRYELVRQGETCDREIESGYIEAASERLAQRVAGRKLLAEKSADYVNLWRVVPFDTEDGITIWIGDEEDPIGTMVGLRAFFNPREVVW